MTGRRQLAIVQSRAGDGRQGRDRLELLEALIASPAFDPSYRADVINFAPFDPVYGWACEVAECEGVDRGKGLCREHARSWAEARQRGTARIDFVADASPVIAINGYDVGSCLICPERPAKNRETGLCGPHLTGWNRRGDRGLRLTDWAANQQPLPGYGGCVVTTCLSLAVSPVGLCIPHRHQHWQDGKPGGGDLPTGWGLNQVASTDTAVFADRAAFDAWCKDRQPVWRVGVVNLIGLHPLTKAEIKWGIHAHALEADQTRWDFGSLQLLANLCREKQVKSLMEIGLGAKRHSDFNGVHNSAKVRMAVSEITDRLRCIYFTRQDTKLAGFIETDQFGRRFNSARSHFSLLDVKQEWLRDLLWEHLAGILGSTQCPRSRGPFDNYRRAVVELSAFLEVDAPEEGRDPRALKAEHAERFAADQRHRERHKMPSLGLRRPDGKASIVSAIARQNVFNHLRRLMYAALESQEAHRIGLSSSFITALPPGGSTPHRSRSPYSDAVFDALIDPVNLKQLQDQHDPNDLGVSDAWETILMTGRRCSEVLTLNINCAQIHNGRHYLWHDQTKVGNFDDAIRIPEYLYLLLRARRDKTVKHFEERCGRTPSPEETAKLAMFPATLANKSGIKPMSYGTFNQKFRKWVRSLDMGPAVTHQARHTLATRLLAAGATLTHIRDYLGHVSDRMAEHYTKTGHASLEDVLRTVWVAGAGSNQPGMLLSGSKTSLSQAQATALALDLSRHSTPAQGGFCTFQPVVQGAACPWDLDCENCDKFVLSGADLLYWRRKEEQWRSIAERAPDDESADYLHSVFEPTAQAIRGLEVALAAMGLLEEALSLDLRRPQDYYQRIWSINFRAEDLASASGDEQAQEDGEEAS